MKKLIYTIVLLIGTICSAQDEILMEYEWKLEYIELNGETLYQPINEESDDSITIVFYEDNFSGLITFFDHNLICNGVSCSDILFNDDISFEIDTCYITLADCILGENVVFESNYMMIYEDFMAGSIPLNPFTYSFVTEEDIIYLTITNSEGNSATYSATTLSDTNFEDISFSIYPNPVFNELYIESNQAQIQKIEIFNLSGKRILATNYQENQSIEVSDLTSGLYLVKIHTENGSFTKKLVKE